MVKGSLSTEPREKRARQWHPLPTFAMGRMPGLGWVKTRLPGGSPKEPENRGKTGRTKVLYSS